MEVQVEAGAAETPEQLEARRNEAIKAWRDSLEPKKLWTEYEKQKRQTAAELCFPNPIKGTQRFSLPDGYKIKLVYGWNYNLGDKDLVDPVLQEKVPIEKQVEAVQDAIEALGNEGPILANRLVRWKPELVEKEYRNIERRINDGIANGPEQEAFKLITSILTITPASPQLSLEEPKL